MVRRLDLTGVTLIDAAGKDSLAAPHRQGAEFVTADCLTRAIVTKITQEPSHGRACPDGTGQPSQNRGAT
jgi:hypothetical protein